MRFQKPRPSSLPPRRPPLTGQPVSSGSCTGTRSWSGRRSFLQRSFPDSCCRDVSVEKLADTEKPTEGDIVLNFRKAVGDGEEWTQTLGDEGYELNLEAESPGVISISARTKRGVRWGCMALGQLLEKSEGQLPAGVLPGLSGVVGPGLWNRRRAQTGFPRTSVPHCRRAFKASDEHAADSFERQSDHFSERLRWDKRGRATVVRGVSAGIGCEK